MTTEAYPAYEIPSGKEARADVNLEEQYDKIYRYCYFKLQHRQKAEDITQETFLRFLESETYQDQGKMLQYLYTIAGNLCVDEFRKMPYEQSGYRFTEMKRDNENDAAIKTSLQNGTDMQEQITTSLTVRAALAKLSQQERELLLLYHVNEVPAAVIAKLMGVSRFAVYRMLKRAERNFKMKLPDIELL